MAKVYAFVADGMEEVECLAVCDLSLIHIAMSKKGWKAGAVLAAGAGITAVLAAKKRGNMEMDKMKKTSHGSRSDYRNTELGKHDKNSKGIYYTNGNYEAFARPEKPAGIEEKSAYLVGSGLASLAAACFLVRELCIRDRFEEAAGGELANDRMILS